MNTPSRIASLRAEQTRRDFISWLGVGVAAAAVDCAEDKDALEAAEMADEELAIACGPTTKDTRGPYWEPGSPERTVALADADEPGVRLFVEGKVVGPDGTPLAGYTLDLWQADAEGAYHSQGRLRGKIKTDAQGNYRFATVLPGRYGDEEGIRPAHLHVSFLSPGQNVLLTTQLYFEGDPYLGQEDYCTRDGTCNAADPLRALRLADTDAGKRTRFNAILPRA